MEEEVDSEGLEDGGEILGENIDGVRVQRFFMGDGVGDEGKHGEAGLDMVVVRAGDVSKDVTEVGMGMWLETQPLPADLTGVLALFPNTGAQHGVCDVARIGPLTLLVFDDGDIGTSQGMRQAHCGDSHGGCEQRSPDFPTPPPQ